MIVSQDVVIRLGTLVLALAVVPFAHAQEAKIVSVSDAAADIPGAMTIRGCTAPDLPHPESAIPQLPGWPVTVPCDGTFAPFRNVVFADLDGDGQLEIIAASTKKKIYAWNVAGVPMPGFPFTTVGAPQYAPSVGDLDGDGRLEIVQATRGLTSGGRLYALDHLGNVLPGFPVSFHDNNLMGAATLADLDDDGELEIIAAEWGYPLGALHVVERNGVEWGGNWPVTLDNVAAATPGVADLDGDGRLEIVYQSYDSLYVLESDGSAVAGWPKTLSNANFSYQSPAFEDLDGDGKLEIVVGAHGNNSGCYVYRLDGSTYPGWPQKVGTWTYCPPTVADLENDGSLEVLLGRAGSIGGASNAFWAWRTDGQVKPGFPYVAPGGGSESPLTVADLDDDGRREILAGSNIMASDGTGYLFGVDATGHDLPGFPLRPKGFTYLNGATIGDVDGDGHLELGVISYDGTTMDVNLYTLPGHYHPAQVEWATYMEKFERGGRRHGGDHLHTGGTFARGQNVSFTVHDVPGDKAFLWVSAATAKLRHPAFGWFHLSFSPLLVALVRNATIPGPGEVTLTVPIPNDPAFAGLPIYLEGLTGANLAGNQGAFTNVVGRVIQ